MFDKQYQVSVTFFSAKFFPKCVDAAMPNNIWHNGNESTSNQVITLQVHHMNTRNNIVTYHYLYIATQEQEYQSRPRSVSFDITNGRRVTNVGCDLMRASKNTTEWWAEME